MKLTGGSNGNDSGSEVCRDLNDEDTCESAWHTTPKGVGIACCWDGDSCEGSAFGFGMGTCTHGNTCFASAGRTAAPAVAPWGLLAIGVALMAIGAKRLRTSRLR